MVINEEVRSQLLAFGIEHALATEASQRYSTVEPAVDWCFGAGANWKPEDNKASLSRNQPLAADIWAPRDSTEHVEYSGQHDGPRQNPAAPPTDVHSPYAPRPLPCPPPLPTRPLGSNNPFRNPLPPSSLAVDLAGVDDDADEQLQEAIRLSQQTGADHEMGDASMPALDGRANDSAEQPDTRYERERSLRATAPPPSPDASELPLGSLFGPSNKVETGLSQLVPAGLQPPNISNEDADMDLAIQNSMMTASMHSQSQLDNAEKPSPMPRRPGAPLVFFSSSGKQTYAAHALQALWAAPQFRAAVDNSRIRTPLQSWSNTEVHESSFYDVDHLLGSVIQVQPTHQLPPNDHCAAFVDDIEYLLMTWLTTQREETERERSLERIRVGSFWDDPEALLRTRLDEWPAGLPNPRYVAFRHTAAQAGKLHLHLARSIWSDDKPNQSIVSLGEVLVVFVSRDFGYGDRRQPWQLEETAVLDRYMKENSARSAQIRAQQSLAQGNVRRLEQDLEKLTTQNGKDVILALNTLVTFLEQPCPGETADEEKSRLSKGAELQSVSEAIKAQAATIQKELEGEKEIAGGKLFETEDPEQMKHTYALRAVSYHDGAVMPGKHLYLYVKQEDGSWWRIQDHEVKPVEWQDIVADETGLHMDGGPYMLVYSRVGPRPDSIAPTSGIAPAATATQPPDVEMKDDQSEIPPSASLTESDRATAQTHRPTEVTGGSSIEDDKQPAEERVPESLTRQDDLIQL